MSSYREIDVLDETKPILLVQDTDTRKMYVKKPIPAHNRELYNKLQAFSFSGIPQIHEFCETEEGLFLYEDYISGQTLQTVLDDSFNLPEDAAVDIICQLCDILSPLHRCDPPIIHRDIKPSNILLTPSDHVILIDFDASREFDAGKPEDTVLLDTREYAAPEQYGFGQSDARSDIYALGVLLNKMLTGTYPRRKCPEGSLGEIITRCTALLPEQRYASVEELKAALTSRSSKSAPPRPARKSHPILAFLLSIGAIMVGTSLSIPTKTSAQHLMQDHICVTLWLLFLVMLLCNIGGISDKLPILRRSTVSGFLFWMLFSGFLAAGLLRLLYLF